MEYDGIINWLGIDYWPAKTSSIPFSSISCSIFTGKSWKSPCHSCPKPRVGIKVFCFAWPHVSWHVIDLEPVPSICRPPTLVPQEIWQNNSTEWIVLGIPALFQMIGLTALANELVSIPQIYTTTLWRTPKKVRPCWAPLSLACPHAVVTTMHFSSVFHIFPLKPVPMSSNVSLSLPVPMYGSPFFWSILGWNRNGFGGPISYQTRGNNFSQIVEFPLCSWNFCHGLKEAWGKNKLEQTTKIVRFLRFPSTVFTIK